MAAIVQQYTSPPEQLDPKRLPPGHSAYQAQGKSKLIMFMGQPYDGKGRKLPKDWDFLHRNNFHLHPAIAQELKSHQPKVRTRACDNLACQNTPSVKDAFCSVCGSPQPPAVLLPGEDQDLTSFLQALDNPFVRQTTQEQAAQPRPERVDPTAYMPTTQEMQEDVYRRHKLPVAATAVQGEGATPTGAKAGIKPGASPVSFANPFKIAAGQ